ITYPERLAQIAEQEPQKKNREPGAQRDEYLSQNKVPDCVPGPDIDAVRIGGIVTNPMTRPLPEMVELGLPAQVAGAAGARLHRRQESTAVDQVSEFPFGPIHRPIAAARSGELRACNFRLNHRPGFDHMDSLTNVKDSGGNESKTEQQHETQQ